MYWLLFACKTRLPEIPPPPPSASPDGLVNGEYLPDFQLPYADGSDQHWHLYDYVNKEGTGKSQGVILGLMASWCGYCRNSLPTVKELQDQYGSKISIVILDVDADAIGAKKEAEIIANAGLTVPVLWSDSATRRALVGDSQSIPRFLFVNKVAEVLVQDRGFGEKVRPMMPKQAEMILAHPEYMKR